MKKIFITAAILFAGLAANAQNYNQYELLKGEGTIPEEFITSSSKKYQANVEQMANEQDKRTQKDKEAFFLESNFELDELLHSGLVLYNDPVTVYLNEVAQKLAVNSPKLQNVRVYALRISAVNAFATDRGNVFVSLGLLAQLEDEAQLAFILSHELTHVEEGHNIELFLKDKEITRETERLEVLRETTYDESALAKHNYSKELETEADNSGLLRLIQQTKYSTKTLKTVFDVLKYSYLPFDEVVFEKSFFEEGAYTFPKTYYLENVKEISGADEDEDDSKSSHPNLAKRREAFYKTVEGVDETGRQVFLVSQERFLNLRQVCRFELCMIYLHNDSYSSAIYAAYMLLKTNPDSLYLKKIIAKALYGITKQHNESGWDSNHYKDIEGQIQRVFYFLSKLSARELNVLALRYNYRLWQANPNDKELKALTEDLFVELTQHFLKLKEFKMEKLASDSKMVAVTEKEDTTPTLMSKYDKIKKQKAEQPQVDSTTATPYWQFAFMTELKDTLFTNKYETALKERTRRTDRDSYYRSSKGHKEYEREKRRDKRRGAALGIDKVVIVNPFYIRADVRGKTQMKYLDSEHGEETLINVLDETAKASGIDYQILDVKRLKSDETDKFNDISMLNDWFSEQMNHNYNSLVLGYNQERIDAIAEKYGTDYFLWTGVVSLKVKSRFSPLLFIFPPIWPYAFIRLYTHARTNESLIYSVLYDVKTGRSRVVNYTYIKRPTREAILKSQFYDTFSQIKHSRNRHKKTK